jgi:DNA-binding NarL/FixJ family response regulator
MAFVIKMLSYLRFQILNKMIRIIIVDDHRMFRESLRKILTIEKVAEVVAEAANGKEFLKLLDQHTPDLVLMDIAMPELNGIETTKLAIEKQPGLKVLCLSSFGDEKYYFNMVEAGAKGFVLKNAGINELENAIREVANGGSWFSSELLQKVIVSLNAKPKKNAASELTEREVEILKLVCESMTNEQIAEKINLSYDTVKWHRSNILSKTGCTNTAGLVIFAIKNQLIEI